MKKKAIFCLILLLVILSFSFQSFADNETEAVERAIPDSAADALDGADPGNADSATGKLWIYVKDNSGGILTDTLKSAVKVLLVPILCSVVGALYDDKLPDTVNMAGALAVAAMCLNGTDSFIGLGTELLDELDAFGKVLLPTLTTAAVSGGAVSSATAKYAAAAMFIELLGSLSKDVIIPLIYAYLAASVGSAVFGGGLGAAARITKWAAVTAMTVTVLCFTLYLTLTGIISGSADAAAIKVTKTAISSALPVVGSIISDAAASVVSGAEMIKSTVGVMGLTVILAACAIPVIRMGMNHLLFKAVAALTQPLGGDKLSKVIGAVGTATGLMLGLCGSMVLMLYISVISIMKVVT